MLRTLKRRSLRRELMDGSGLGDAGLQSEVLADLAEVNRLTRTHAPVLQFLRQAWSRLPRERTLHVLDIGCGQGDLLRRIWAAAREDGRRVALCGLDLHPHAVLAARLATPPDVPVRYVAADVFEHQPQHVDFVVCAQVAHHLTDAQLLGLLGWVERHAREGWCITDLRRHWLPYLGFRWLARLLDWHPVVQVDGTRSIARAWTPLEWKRLLQQAGVEARVRCHLPFRLAVSSAPRSPVGAIDDEDRVVVDGLQP